MIVVFRCSARNWLLFVVEPPAVFTVSHCVCLCLCVYVHRRVCVCMHTCVCVWRGQDILCLLRCASEVCDLQLGSFMSLFPPLSVRSLCPAWSRSSSTPSVLPASPLSSYLSPPSLSLSLHFSLFHCARFLIRFFPPAFTRCFSINGVHQDVNSMGVKTCFSPLTANCVYLFTANHFPKHKFFFPLGSYWFPLFSVHRSPQFRDLVACSTGWQ